MQILMSGGPKDGVLEIFQELSSGGRQLGTYSKQCNIFQLFFRC